MLINGNSNFINLKQENQGNEDYLMSRTNSSFKAFLYFISELTDRTIEQKYFNVQQDYFEKDL